MSGDKDKVSYNPVIDGHRIVMVGKTISHDGADQKNHSIIQIEQKNTPAEYKNFFTTKLSQYKNNSHNHLIVVDEHGNYNGIFMVDFPLLGTIDQSLNPKSSSIVLLSACHGGGQLWDMMNRPMGAATVTLSNLNEVTAANAHMPILTEASSAAQGTKTAKDLDGLIYDRFMHGYDNGSVAVGFGQLGLIHPEIELERRRANYHGKAPFSKAEERVMEEALKAHDPSADFKAVKDVLTKSIDGTYQTRLDVIEHTPLATQRQALYCLYALSVNHAEKKNELTYSKDDIELWHKALSAKNLDEFKGFEKQITHKDIFSFLPVQLDEKGYVNASDYFNAKGPKDIADYLKTTTDQNYTSRTKKDQEYSPAIRDFLSFENQTFLKEQAVLQIDHALERYTINANVPAGKAVSGLKDPAVLKEIQERLKPSKDDYFSNLKISKENPTRTIGTFQSKPTEEMDSIKGLIKDKPPYYQAMEPIVDQYMKDLRDEALKMLHTPVKDGEDRGTDASSLLGDLSTKRSLFGNMKAKPVMTQVFDHGKV